MDSSKQAAQNRSFLNHKSETLESLFISRKQWLKKVFKKQYAFEPFLSYRGDIMLIGYARVSTEEQSLARQIDALVAAGVDARNIYQEKRTGTRKDRPALIRMLSELQAGDTVLCAELSRISRSTRDLLDIVEQIGEKGADIKSLKESWIDTTTAHGKMFFTFIAGMNQFERDLISERTLEGLKAAKKRGKVGGRPSKVKKYAEEVLLLYQGGRTMSEISQVLPISLATVKRVLKNKRDDS